MYSGHKNIKRILHRINEEIYSTKEISKVVGIKKAIVSFRGKVDIQIMVNNGRIEHEWIKKNLLKKHEVMNEYFKKTCEVVPEKNIIENMCLQDEQYRDCIWICWWQGVENAPEIVKKCIDSIKANAGKYKVQVITDENVNQYVQFPEWIIEKKQKGIITKTHISDLLRLELLSRYGGIWLDSTFFCTGSLEKYVKQKLWTIKRPDYRHVSVSCGQFANYSFGCDSEHRYIFEIIKQYLYGYWKKYDYMIDYLFLDYLIVQAINNHPIVRKAFEEVEPNNPKCDELLKILGKSFNQDEWQKLKEKTDLFKLTWKESFTNDNSCNETYYTDLLNGKLIRN